MPTGTAGTDFDPLEYVTNGDFDQLDSKLQGTLKAASERFTAGGVDIDSTQDLSPIVDRIVYMADPTASSTTTCH